MKGESTSNEKRIVEDEEEEEGGEELAIDEKKRIKLDAILVIIYPIYLVYSLFELFIRQIYSFILFSYSFIKEQSLKDNQIKGQEDEEDIEEEEDEEDEEIDEERIMSSNADEEDGCVLDKQKEHHRNAFEFISKALKMDEDHDAVGRDDDDDHHHR